MKRFMVVYVIDDEPGAVFYDDYEDAYKFSMDAVFVGGGYAEIYIRIENELGIMVYSPI